MHRAKGLKFKAVIVAGGSTAERSRRTGRMCTERSIPRIGRKRWKESDGCFTAR